jgi:hypothetical protein
LTTPEGLDKEELPKEVISLQIRYDESRPLSVETMVLATKSLSELYDSLGRVLNVRKVFPLTLLNADAGSMLRIDLKGLGEPVKYLKELIIEAWQKVRDWKAEKLKENNLAALTSLKVIDEIEKKVQNGSLSPEEGEILKRNICRVTLSLFESGALIHEIRPTETIDNQKLIEGFQPKLLPAPKGVEARGKRSRVPQRKRKKRAKKESETGVSKDDETTTE